MTQIIPQMYAQPGQQHGPHNAVHPQQHGHPQYRNGPEGHSMNPSYGPPPPPGVQPSQINPNRPEMAPVHPQYHQPYHQPHEMPRLPGLPPAPNSYYGPPPQDYRPPQQNTNTQSAPRQRTAIACKYCRRRKIRCSGFENSEDGRCTNCARFSQTCIFTPVSAQTQAFVPAQAVYGPRGSGGPPQPTGPPQFYGSYGQPLPRQPEGYPPPQGYGLHSPSYPPPPGQHPYGAPAYPPQQHYEQQPAGAKRRTRDEPHTPTLPPPNPGAGAHLATHPGQEHSPYGYPDPNGYPNGAVSPNSAGSYQTHQPQPYYNQPPSHNSPAAPYQYDQPRGSNSPHGQPAYGYGQPTLAPHPSQSTGQGTGRTPPPLAGASDNGSSRNGVAIRDIVSDSNGQGERTAADSDMVSALNRTSRR